MKTIKLPYNVKEEGRAKQIGTEIINKDHIIDMCLCELNNSSNIAPVMVITTNENTDYAAEENDCAFYEVELANAFHIHHCNEFMRSLNLGIDVSFESYDQYEFLVENCMNELRIKRIMDSLELPDGVTPDEVNFIVLGRLSNKDKVNLIAALVDNLEAKVHEAVQIIRKERVTA